MKREITFLVPGDALWSKAKAQDATAYFRAIKSQLMPPWGEMGKVVGFGFEATTRSRVTNKRLNLLRRRLLRALVTTRIMSPDAVKNDVYNLQQRIRRSENAGVLITMREE